MASKMPPQNSVAEEVNEDDDEEMKDDIEEEEFENSDEDVDEEDESDDDEDDESDDERVRSRRKRNAFIPPPPRELPTRTTRGQRLGTVAAVQDDQADEEFWNQEFFAEEERDQQYETESEPEDRFDADFMDSEEEEIGDEDEAAEEEAKAQEKKKKILKPPGYKRPAPPKKVRVPTAAATEPPTAAADSEQEIAAKKPPRRTSAEVAAMIAAERTVSVRQSTRQKVQEAEEERKVLDALKPRRVSKPTVARQLTQAELLAEAARTEIENTRSLQVLVAIEEESKKKAHIKRGKYVGPMIRLRSAAAPATEDGTPVEVNGVDRCEERTTLEVRNMQTPAYLQRQEAPPPPTKAVCVITGRPARYRDPTTGLPYADLAAYKELQRRRVLQQQQAGVFSVDPSLAQGHAALFLQPVAVTTGHKIICNSVM